MTHLKIELTFDPTEFIVQAIEGTSLTGLGNNGDSEYSVVDVSVDFEPITVTVDIDLEREGGLFVSKDDLESEIIGELNELDGISV